MTHLEIHALAGLILYPEACERARQVAHWQTLFADPIAQALAEYAVTGKRDLIDDIHPLFVPIAELWLDAAETWRPVLSDDPADPEWALHCLNLLVVDRALAALPATLRWAANSIERRRLTLAYVRKRVGEMFQIAEGTR